MTTDKLTVVTATFGDSGGRLARLCSELRKFTKLPYKHIVCDDGTLDPKALRLQQDMCCLHHATWLQNPGPTWGVSYNLNYALSHVETPWAMLVEDGVRPSYGWLEAALSFIDKIGERKWRDLKVGMAGTTHIQDWVLAAVNNEADPVRVYDGLDLEKFNGDWNDGLHSWARIKNPLNAVCRAETPGWKNEMLILKDFARGFWPPVLRSAPAWEQDQCEMKFNPWGRWPAYRTARCCWWPGPLLLLNMDAFHAVGGCRAGATFFEGLLGLRMGRAGYLSLYVEFPPWLHQPSQCFADHSERRQPVDHRNTDAVLRADYGAPQATVLEVLADRLPPAAMLDAVDEELRLAKLDAVPEWAPWM